MSGSVGDDTRKNMKQAPSPELRELAYLDRQDGMPE